jgi:hypothetical protein
MLRHAMEGGSDVPKKAEAPAPRIVQLWLQRPKSKRTDDDVLVFYGWLSEHEPGLIPSGSGSYKQLHKILSDHLLDQA